jgi:ubiquinone biosynthesis protein UbiJ
MGGFFYLIMISPSPTFVLFVNHLLAQESWATDKLSKHSGKTARIDLQAFSLSLKISGDGRLEAQDADSAADVTIRLKLSDLPLIAQNRERAFSYVKVEGDADLANTISHLSQHLRWELEDDLSKLFGDVAAVRLVSTAKALIQSAQQTHQKLSENLAEYFLEENPMLVRPVAVAAFGTDVNQCRDDVERLIKRIERLEKLKKGRE